MDREHLEKLADTINDALDTVELNRVQMDVVDDISEASQPRLCMHISVQDKDWSYFFRKDCSSMQDVAQELTEAYFDKNEQRKEDLAATYQNGCMEEEKDVLTRYDLIEQDFSRATKLTSELAVNERKTIPGSLRALKKEWEAEDKKELQQECKDFFWRMNDQYGASFEDTMKAMKKFYKNYEHSSSR